VKRITKKQKIGLIFLGIFLTLVVLELGLRLGGFIMTSYSNRNNRITGNVIGIEKEKEYRILALGESTTENSGYSWPEQLQHILNNESKRNNFTIINKGKGGTTNAFILSRTRQYIEDYHPDIIITMMGINDDSRFDIYYKETFKVRAILFFQNFRIYKLSRLISKHWKEKTVNVDEEKILTEETKESHKFHNLGRDYFKNGDIEMAGKMFKKAIELNPNYEHSYYELGFIYYNKEDYKKAEEMFEKAIELNPHLGNGYALVWLGKAYEKVGKFNEAEEVFEKAIKVNPEAHSAYNALWTIYQKNNETINEEYFSSEYKDMSSIKYHYQLLYNITKERGIKLVIMQYPTRDIEDFKDYFNEEQQKDIIFIENKDNFEKALEKYGYDKIFVDKFAWSIGYNFGHCTERGNMLIAENVANVILEEINISN
jgi:tetratricopeptide (TPR) repeat protein